MESLYEIVALDNKGKEVKLEVFKGKVLLIVNTATGCGFTPQYKGLQELYEKYHDKGFEILDFPCNQFMNQAPGSDAEIQELVGRFGKRWVDIIAKRLGLDPNKYSPKEIAYLSGSN